MIQTPEIRLSKKWFNPIYFHLRKYVDEPSIRRIMIYGGKSAAKTFSVGQLFLILGHCTGASSILYRKQQATIKTTLKETILKAIESIYFQNAYQEMDFRISGAIGNDLVLKGLDEDSKIKGIEGFRFLLFDELDHFEQDEWMQANLSLRGMHNQKLFATWNPVDENIWIKKELDRHTWTDLPLEVEGIPQSRLHEKSFVRISDDGKTLLIKTTYHDNKWVVGADGFGYRDENLIHEYESLRHTDEIKYNVNVLGEWGRLRTGMEYYHAFNTAIHIGRPEYVPTAPLHITFDMNVNPYMTLLVNQIILKEQRFHVNVIDEFCLGHPLNKTRYVCQAFYRKYYEQLHHKNGLFYYGDATSKKNNTMTVEEIKNDYDIIEDELRIMLNSASCRVPKGNPPVLKRKDFMHEVLTGKTPIILLIHEDCKNTCNDFIYLKEGADGKKFKEVDKEKITGAKFQKYGHTSDAEEYLLCEAFDNIFRQYERR